MDETLNASDSSPIQKNTPNWRLFGELALSNVADSDEQIHSWLKEILRPLSLHPEFLERIARSARDAAARALQPELKLAHIHLKIFGPRESNKSGQTWGFFRVEKVESVHEGDDSASHAVEFYLYTEGRETQ
jgi:hypothetical protein